MLEVQRIFVHFTGVFLLTQMIAHQRALVALHMVDSGLILVPHMVLEPSRSKF